MMMLGVIKSTIKKEAPFAIGTPAIIWQILFFYIPLLIMCFSSILHFSQKGTFTGLTLSHFTPLLKPSYFYVIFSSLFLAFSTAVCCLLIGYPLAYFIACISRKYKSILLFLLIVPFWTNFLLHVYAWYFVLERGGFVNNLLMHLGFIKTPIHFLNSIFSIMLMMVYYYLPFMALPLFSSLEKFDKRMMEASLDLGASHLQTFRTVLLPLTLPAIRAGFFLVFIPAFGEFAIPELMGGDKYFFVGNVISQFILGEQTESLGAAFTVLSSLSLIITALILYAFSKRFYSYLTRRKAR